MDTSKFKYKLGHYLRKKSGSQWEGKVVGFYSTDLTPEGYAIESSAHAGSVQIYPVNALEPVLILVKSAECYECKGCYYEEEHASTCPHDGANNLLCAGLFIWIQAGD